MNSTPGSEPIAPTTRSGATAEELGLTMTRILKNPLAALRASMESLARDLPSDDPHGEQVRAALDEVLRLSRGVQDLADYAAPRELRALTCTAEELLFSTLRLVPEALRGRLRVARPDSSITIDVDGPTLCLALRHLAEYTLANSGGDVLFGAREEDGSVLFTLVGEADAARDRDSVQLDLGLHLAGRDIPRMGGTLTLQRSPRRATCIQVALPAASRKANRKGRRE